MSDRVLLAEDEFFVAMDVEATIEDMGMTVDGPYRSVAELRAALEGDGRYACAVLDVQLEDGEVFGVADALYAARVPMVLHSGHADEDCLRARFPHAAICAKPSTPGDMRRCIEGVIAAALAG